MKKFLLLALVAMLALTLVVSCDDNESDKVATALEDLENVNAVASRTQMLMWSLEPGSYTLNEMSASDLASLFGPVTRMFVQQNVADYGNDGAFVSATGTITYEASNSFEDGVRTHSSSFVLDNCHFVCSYTDTNGDAQTAEFSFSLTEEVSYTIEDSILNLRETASGIKMNGVSIKSVTIVEKAILDDDDDIEEVLEFTVNGVKVPPEVAMGD